MTEQDKPLLRQSIPDEVAAPIRLEQFDRIAEFWAYPGWNKTVENKDGEIDITVTRRRDGVQHRARIEACDRIGSVATFVLIAGMATDTMEACDEARCEGWHARLGNSALCWPSKPTSHES